MLPGALLDDFTVAEKNDLIGNAFRLGDIMGDHNNGNVFAERDDEVFNGAGGHRVDRGCGLIE